MLPLPSLHHSVPNANNAGSTPNTTALLSSWIQGDHTLYRKLIQWTEDTYVNYDNVTSHTWARPTACVGHSHSLIWTHRLFGRAEFIAKVGPTARRKTRLRG
ncbi:hypothetical protein K439DRAFT_561931 [Ramaria rubella]|nr:hypothetical protein K439DRAFT_561931 [Ramaria rubella]